MVGHLKSLTQLHNPTLLFVLQNASSFTLSREQKVLLSSLALSTELLRVSIAICTE